MLDALKAFDKLVHPLLCSELLDRQVPVADAVLLRHMLSGVSGVVDFHGTRSSGFLLELLW